MRTMAKEGDSKVNQAGSNHQTDGKGKHVSSKSFQEHKGSESSDITSRTESPMTIQYCSGNPSVEVTKGIMHLYKDKYVNWVLNHEEKSLQWRLYLSIVSSF